MAVKSLDITFGKADRFMNKIHYLSVTAPVYLLNDTDL